LLKLEWDNSYSSRNEESVTTVLDTAFPWFDMSFRDRMNSYIGLVVRFESEWKGRLYFLDKCFM
jgi:hypothetical protein